MVSNTELLFKCCNLLWLHVILTIRGSFCKTYDVKSGLLLEAGTRAPAPVYCERSTRLFCLGNEKGKPKKS